MVNSEWEMAGAGAAPYRHSPFTTHHSLLTRSLANIVFHRGFVFIFQRLALVRIR